MHRWLFLLVAACTVGEDGGGGIEAETHEDVEGGTLVLEGDALVAELTQSPGHEALREFVRLGVIFDAPSPTAIQMSVSADGERWSDWVAPTVHHVEHEETGAFVAQIELLPGGVAKHFRVRGQATFLRVEEMIFSQSENVEAGEGAPDTAVVIGGPDGVQGRTSWGARASRCSSPLGVVRRMAIHHTESPTIDKLSVEARLRQIQSYHMDVKGWCDIGYHYLVSRDGRIWEGRPVARLGSHAGGANTGNVGIAVIGSHDTTPVSDVQVDAIAGLVRSVADVNGIALDRSVVKGHREYKSTSCPGDRLEGQLDGILATGRSETPTQAPPDEAGDEATTILVRGVLYVGNDPSDGIAGATITIGDRTTTTQLDGSWELSAPAGTFIVSATAAGYRSAQITRSGSTNTWASFGLSLANSSSGNAGLQGVVYFGSSGTNRIPFATVTLSTGQTLDADGNGYYKLGDLPPGPITITASAPGYETASVSRTLTNSLTEWGSVRLAP